MLSHNRWWILAIGVSLGPAVGISALGAQVPDPAKKPTARDSLMVDSAVARERRRVLRQASPIEWHDVVLVAGGVAVLTLLDETIQQHVQESRSETLTGVADFFRQGGEPVVYAGVSLGVLGVGLVTGDAGIKRAGGRLVASVAGSVVLMQSVKWLIGRSRPNEEVGAFEFHPFSSRKDTAGLQARGALPSGHAAIAFTIAASLADDINFLPADIVLYALATGTAYSRVYHNRHWFTDVVMGAALGITTSKVIAGRWRIFNLKPPAFLITPTGAPALSWSIPFSTSPHSPPSPPGSDGKTAGRQQD
jgi:membrane-associated phospholipid phosphatase